MSIVPGLVYRFYKFIAIFILVVVLYLVYFFSGGFTLIIGGASEFWVSQAGIGKITASLAIALVLLIIALIIALILKIRIPLASKQLLKIIVPGIITLVLILAFITSIIVQPGSGRYILENYVEVIDEPIPVTMTRIIPLETAYAYAVSLLQVPTHTIYLGEAYIYYNNSIAVYNWIVEPEGFWNQIGRDSLGVILVEGEYPPRVKLIEKDLYWSLHRIRIGAYIDSLYRILKAIAPSAKPLFEDNIEVVVDNEVYILIPLETWVTGWDYSIPVLYGYGVVDSSGGVEVVAADKIMEHKLLSRIFSEYSIPVLPEAIAREWIELLRWSPGYWEVMLYHRTYEIRDIGVNPQPYLVFDENGHLYWLFVVEPSGESYAIKHLIYVDAESIEPRILLYTPKEPLIGISKVETYIKKAHPTFDWGQFRLAEPIPIILNNTLYWKVTIITSDGRGVVSIDLIDARTGNVYSLPVKERLGINEFYGFLAEKLVANITTPTKPTNITSNVTDALTRIKDLEERVEKMIDELQKILDELRALEKMVSNQTRSSG